MSTSDVGSNIDNRHPYWIGSTVWCQYKTLFTSVFRASNFSTLALALVPVLHASVAVSGTIFWKIFAPLSGFCYLYLLFRKT